MSAPGKPPNLWDPRIAAPSADRRPVQGAMAAYVGPQYSAQELWDYYCQNSEVYPDEVARLRPLAERIRAFDVPGLRGAMFTADRLGGVARALQATLLERLPGTFWDLSDTARIPGLTKYNIFHVCTPAPIDALAQEPMVLEVFGRLTGVDGEKRPRGWLIDWYKELPAEELGRADDMTIGEMAFAIERASYANTRTPGIGVPFYL